MHRPRMHLDKCEWICIHTHLMNASLNFQTQYSLEEIWSVLLSLGLKNNNNNNNSNNFFNLVSLGRVISAKLQLFLNISSK